MLGAFSCDITVVANDVIMQHTQWRLGLCETRQLNRYIAIWLARALRIQPACYRATTFWAAVTFVKYYYTKTEVGTPKNHRPPWIHKSQHDYPLRQPITDLPTFENFKKHFFFQTFHEKKLWKVAQSISGWTDIENPYRLSGALYIYICWVLGITF